MLRWLFPDHTPHEFKNKTFLCDECKYNDSRYCSRPDRPNAVKCPDYKKQ